MKALKSRLMGCASGAAMALAVHGACAQASSTDGATSPTTVTTPPSAASASPAAAPENIIVTAQKRSERLQDVPMSINAISARQLLQRGITDTSQLERLVPGFTFEKTAYGLPVYFIRGIGFNDTTLGVSPGVTVYTDQIPFPFAPMSRGAVLDLERVEVLKGPQGTLFGQNSTGGAVNYIAAKPSHAFDTGFDLTYGRFNEVDAERYVTGAVTDTVTVRLSARDEYQSDWQKGYTTRESVGQKNFQNARMVVDWKPSDTVRFELMATGWVDRSDTQQPQLVEYAPTAPAVPNRPVPTYPVASFPTAPNDARAAAFDPNGDFRRDDHFYQVSGRADVDLASNVRLTSLTSYEGYKQSLPLDLDGTTYPIDVTTDRGNINSFSQELRLNGSIGDRTRWMIGGNYERDAVSERLVFNPTLDNGDHLGPFYWTSFNIDNFQKVDTESGFASIDYRITSQLTAQGSARYTNQSRDFAGCTRDSGNGEIATAFSALSSQLTGAPQRIPAGGCVTLSNTGLPLAIVTKKLDQDNVSWRGSLNWKVMPNALLYINVTKGYKAGSFPTLPAATANQYVPVSQESVLAYEGGFKLDTFGRRLQLDGAIFYYDYIDKQLVGYLVVQPFGPLPSLVTIPHSRVEGGEISATLHPLDGLTITASGTYIDTWVNSNPINPTGPFGNPGNFVGQRFAYTPKFQGVLDGQYSFRISDRLSGFGGASLSARSEANGALLTGTTALASQEALLKIPGYALLDLRAGIQTEDGHWRLEVFGRNVTNHFYETAVTRNADYVSRFTGMPMTYGLTLHYRFS